MYKKLKESIIFRIQMTSKGPNLRIRDERCNLVPPLYYFIVNPDFFFLAFLIAVLKILLAFCHTDKHLLRTSVVNGIMLKTLCQISTKLL